MGFSPVLVVTQVFKFQVPHSVELQGYGFNRLTLDVNTPLTNANLV